MAAWELNPLSRRLFDDGRQRRAGAAVLMLAALLAFAGGLLWHGGCGGSLPCCLLEDGTAVRARAAGPPLEVVVAHFAGNLSFVPSLLAELGGSPKLTVYSKSPEPPTGGWVGWGSYTSRTLGPELAADRALPLLPPRLTRLARSAPAVSRPQAPSSCPTWGARATPSWPTCTAGTTRWQTSRYL